MLTIDNIIWIKEKIRDRIRTTDSDHRIDNQLNLYLQAIVYLETCL